MPLPTAQDFINGKQDLDDLAEMLVSPEDKLVATRFGSLKRTLASWEARWSEAIANTGGVPIGDGVYSAGKAFSNYNEYLVDAGVPYRSATVPYAVDVSTYPNAADDPSLRPWVFPGEMASGRIRNGILSGFRVYAKAEATWLIYAAGPYACRGLQTSTAETSVAVSAGDKYLYIKMNGDMESSPVALTDDGLVLIAELGLRFDVTNRQFVHDGIDGSFGTPSTAGEMAARNAQIWKQPPADDLDAQEVARRFRAGGYPLPYINTHCGYSGGVRQPKGWPNAEALATWDAPNKRLNTAVDAEQYRGLFISGGYINADTRRNLFEDIFIDQGSGTGLSGQLQFNVGPATGNILRDVTIVSSDFSAGSGVCIGARCHGWVFERVLGYKSPQDFMQCSLNDSIVKDCASIECGLVAGGYHADSIQIGGQYGYVDYTPKTITAVTQANPGVFTVAGHGLAIGNEVVIVPGTMLQLPKRAIVATVPDANTFTLKTVAGVALDTSAFTAYTSGGTIEATNQVVTNGGRVSNFTIDNFVGYVLDESLPWGTPGIAGNACITLASAQGYVSDALITRGYLSGGSYALRIEHSASYTTERVAVRDVLIGLDNIYGFAAALSNGGSTADPFSEWSNVRRVDSGELLRKPVVNAPLTWTDYA